VSRVKSARYRLSLTLLTTAKYLTIAAVNIRPRRPAARTDTEIMDRAAQIVLRKAEQDERMKRRAAEATVSILTALKAAHTDGDEQMHTAADHLISEVDSPTMAHMMIDMLAHYTAFAMPDEDLKDLAQSLVEVDLD
jgi:hypothetical protein